MTDGRFCRKVIKEAKMQFEISEAKISDRRNSLVLSYPRKTYDRIVRLLDAINELSDEFYLEEYNSNRYKIAIKRRNNN